MYGAYNCIKSEVLAVGHNSWNTLLDPFVIFLFSFNYKHVLYFVFLVLVPLWHSNYFKLCELDLSLKCIVTLETHAMVAVEHNIHFSLRLKDMISGVCFLNAVVLTTWGSNLRWLYMASSLKCARHFLCILYSCVLWINTYSVWQNVFRLVKMCLMPGSVPVPVM